MPTEKSDSQYRTAKDLNSRKSQELRNTDEIELLIDAQIVDPEQLEKMESYTQKTSSNTHRTSI
jgi:hypothetical protein